MVSAFKITSEQVSSAFRANPLPRQKVRVTGQRGYFRNPYHLSSSTFSNNQSHSGGLCVGDKSHGRPGPRPVGSARRRGHGQGALHSGSRAPLPRARAMLRWPPGQQVPPGLGPSRGSTPPRAEGSREGRQGGSGAWGGAGARSPSSILRRAEEGKAGLGADRAGDFSGSGGAPQRPLASRAIPLGLPGTPRGGAVRGTRSPSRTPGRPPTPSREGRRGPGGAGGER